MNPAKDQCRVAGASYDANGPLVGPTVPTVFDTTNCAETRFEGGLNIKLRSDMVIFAKSFYSTGDFKVTSADGAQHKFWVIVPDRIPNGIAECSGGAGNIKNDSGSLAIAPITLFMYTPCTIDTNNSTDFYGQLYGGTVQLRNSMTDELRPHRHPGCRAPQHRPRSAAPGTGVDVVVQARDQEPVTGLLVAVAGVLGLAIGSFLNVVVWRVPRGESVVHPPSACPRCGHADPARATTCPSLSWLLLRGRCRDCGSADLGALPAGRGRHRRALRPDGLVRRPALGAAGAPLPGRDLGRARAHRPRHATAAERHRAARRTPSALVLLALASWNPGGDVGLVRARAAR